WRRRLKRFGKPLGRRARSRRIVRDLRGYVAQRQQVDRRVGDLIGVRQLRLDRCLLLGVLLLLLRRRLEGDVIAVELGGMAAGSAEPGLIVSLEGLAVALRAGGLPLGAVLTSRVSAAPAEARLGSSQKPPALAQ